jgi:prepilin-type processing-associated H-X9-DG protein
MPRSLAAATCADSAAPSRRQPKAGRPHRSFGGAFGQGEGSTCHTLACRVRTSLIALVNGLPLTKFCGGANFLFADGSVHFLSYAADDVLPALATRSDGEVVTLP